MREITKTISGYCPEQEANAEISVTFSEYTPVGSPPIVRKIAFKCPFAQENHCETGGVSGEDCPIFRSAHIQ